MPQAEDRTEIGSALCENCGQPAHKRCSRCKGFSVCTLGCMKAIWRRHKPDCDKMLAGGKLLEAAGDNSPGVPCVLRVEDVARLNAYTMEVFRRHGVEEPPKRESAMSSQKKVAFFLDALREHDTSPPEKRSLPINEKLFLNRRYNILYSQAMEALTRNEMGRLNELLSIHHIGMANQ